MDLFSRFVFLRNGFFFLLCEIRLHSASGVADLMDFSSAFFFCRCLDLAINFALEKIRMFLPLEIGLWLNSAALFKDFRVFFRISSSSSGAAAAPPSPLPP